MNRLLLKAFALGISLGAEVGLLSNLALGSDAPAASACLKMSKALRGIFSSEQLTIIEEEQLSEHIQSIATYLGKPEANQALPLLAGARYLKQEHLTLASDNIYFKNLIFYKVPLAEALARYRGRLIYDAWSIGKIKRTEEENPDNMVSHFQDLDLKQTYRDRLVRVYSLCIDAYKDPEDRQFMRKVEVADKTTMFTNPPKKRLPKGRGHSVLEPMPLDSVSDPREKAFRLMINASKQVSSQMDLDDWNKACLAKCVADEMIEFKEPSKHPLTTIRSLWNYMLGSRAISLSHKAGVCIDYAGITKSFALELGFGDRVRLTHEGQHWYNQFQIDGKWYHLHPLRKFGKDCVFMPYESSI